MAYREVTMFEVKEVLQLWLAGRAKKKIARLVGLDPKTVRRYVRLAEEAGLSKTGGLEALTDDVVAEVVAALRAVPGRPRGGSRALCEQHRAFIDKQLRGRVRLSKVRRLLKRRGVQIPYATLHRFAVAELGFGRAALTIPVADCEPGEEVQLDTGWMTLLEADLFGKRRRFQAWIFTAVRSRHRFVYPTFRERTVEAIEACEAAWAFFGGVFRVLIPDNTKAIVVAADPLKPVINSEFREYAQSRGFHIDPARVRRPQDKGRVERAVPSVREDCFGGEHLQTLEDARQRAENWCLEEYGMRRHSTTQRLPREHFEAEEVKRLSSAPTEPYDVPLWRDPKVQRDQHAVVDKALYSLPPEFVGRKLRARADRSTVRFYDRGQLVKTHPRQAPGGRSSDPNDFPPEKWVYASRDAAFLLEQAKRHGEAVGAFAKAILDGPLPWTRMRMLYALLGLVKRYGKERVEETCVLAVAAEMFEVKRLERMLEQARPRPPEPPAPRNVVPITARYLRPAERQRVLLGDRGSEDSTGGEET